MDDYPGMDAREDDRGVAASSVEWNAAREGSGVRDCRKVCIAGPAAGGTREYDAATQCPVVASSGPQQLTSRR